MWRVAHGQNPYPFCIVTVSPFPPSLRTGVPRLLVCVRARAAFGPLGCNPEKLKTQAGGKGVLLPALLPSGARQHEPSHCALPGYGGWGRGGVYRELTAWDSPPPTLSP